MSIVRVTRINRDATQGATERDYRKSYEVQVSSTNDDEAMVLNAAGIPAIGSQHPIDPSAIVTSKSARLREERRWPLWIVDVNYAVQVGEGDVVTRPPDQAPDQWVAELRVRAQAMEREIIEDLDGAILQNAAKDMFPAHMRTITEYYPVVSYRRWWRAADFSPAGAVRLWCGKVNEAAWYDAAAGEAQIQSVSSEREVWTPPTGNAQLFFRVDYEIAIRSGGWLLVLPNEGLHTLTGINFDGIGKKPVMLPEMDDSGNPTGLRYRASEPVPLTDDGRAVRDYGLPVQQLSFRVYDDLDFATAGL